MNQPSKFISVSNFILWCLLIYSVVPPSLHIHRERSRLRKVWCAILVSVSDPRFRHSTWIRTAKHAGAQLLMTDNWDWRAVCVSPLIYSFCSRVLVGVLLVRAADDGPRQESVEVNQVTVPALVSPQVKQTIQGHVPRSQTHTTGKLGEITQWFPTEIIYYTKLESSADYGCSSIRGVFDSQLKYIDIWK